jgi:EmrB/QacA subfamily drug resistance transporter
VGPSVTQQIDLDRLADDRPTSGGTDVRSAPERGGGGTAVRPSPAPAVPRPEQTEHPTRTVRPAAPIPGSGQGDSRSWLAPLGVLIIGMFMSILDTSIVNVALPTIQLELGISSTDGQWVSTAYSLAEGVMVPVSAWLGYRYGSKRIYLLCLAGFTAASFLCGLAGGLETLVVFRILQAIPGGVIPVTCMVMLRRMVPPDRLGAAMGLYGLGVIVAPAIGPSLGGLLVEYTDWRFIFFVNIPVGVLGVVAAAVVLQEEPGRRDRPLDVLGFLTIAVGLFTMLLALEEGKDWGWTSYRILILFTVAALCIALFVLVELEVDRPLLDLRVFTHFQFVLPLVLVSAVSMAMFASAFFVPQFLQGASRGLTPLNTGLLLIPQALVLAVFLPMSGVLYDRVGARRLAVPGLLLAGAGLLLLSRINVDIPNGDLVLGMCVLAAGVGLGMMPVMSSGLGAVPAASAESASSFNTLVQRVSQAFGLGLLNAFLTVAGAQGLADRSGLLGGADPQVAGVLGNPAELYALYQRTAGIAQAGAFSQAFLAISVLCFLGAVLALFLPSGRPAPRSGAAMAH